MNSDVTIVIQGPLHENGIKSAANYLKYGPVIFSCWNWCDTKRINGKFPFVVNKIPKTKFFNRSNILFQSLTSYNGIRQVETDFVIKVRCDEAYSDLSYFIEVVRKNPECMTTNDIFFRYDKFMKFHPSDHVIGGRTNYLLKTFGMLVLECQTKDFINARPISKLTWYEKHNYPELTLIPEVLIATRFLRAKGVSPIPSKSVKIMKENFKLVKTSQMGQFIVSAVGRKATNEAGMRELEMINVRSIQEIDGGRYSIKFL